MLVFIVKRTIFLYVESFKIALIAQLSALGLVLDSDPARVGPITYNL